MKSQAPLCGKSNDDVSRANSRVAEIFSFSKNYCGQCAARRLKVTGKLQGKTYADISHCC
jgi:hypothetical protein